MDILAPVTDYIRGSVLTSKGDLVKHDGSVPVRLPKGNPGQIIRADFIEGDILYEDPGDSMFESEDNDRNVGAVTITTDPIDIVTLDMGPIINQERYFISYHVYFQKDAVEAGQVRIALNKHSGDGDFRIYENLTELYSYTNLLTNQYGTSHGTIILKIITTGMITMRLRGLCDIGSAEVGPQNAQMYGCKLRRRYIEA